MAEKSQHPARINEQLFNYWESKKSGRAIPLEADINPDDLGAVWNSCFLVNVLDDGRMMKYSYMGTALIDMYGDDVTNFEIVTHLVDATHPPLYEKLQRVLKEKQSLMDEGSFTNVKGMNIRYRGCLLPLADGAGNITYVLGGMKWKSY